MARLHVASTVDPDMLYLLSYNASDPVIYLERSGVARVFLNVLEREAFRQLGNQALEVVPLEDYRKPGDQVATVAAIVERFGVNEPLLVPPQFPAVLADGLRKHGCEVVIDSEWGRSRWLKSPLEISAIAANMEVTAGAFKLIESIFELSTISNDTIIYDSAILTSEELKRQVAHYFLDYDLVSPAGMIISCGADAALPHHTGTGPIRPHQTIVVDLFPHSTVNHYYADMTRTYVKGTPSDRVVAMYEAVAQAQRASLAALAPGIMANALYQVSADAITAAGFGVGDVGYIHSLGHGLGVALHEVPTLGPGSEMVLQPGMVLTIEPGLYYKEHGGVRREDTVVVTDAGYRNLTNHQTDWIIA